jgi:hypothetical protein
LKSFLQTRHQPGDNYKQKRNSKNEKTVAVLSKAKTLKGYKLHSRNVLREIGKVKGFCFDDQHWAFRYLIINTQNWRPGKKALVSPQWIERVSWRGSKVCINFASEAIKPSPEYTERSLPTREYEDGLHRHYDREGYLIDDPNDKGLHAMKEPLHE